jgi:hypothetical protein
MTDMSRHGSASLYMLWIAAFAALGAATCAGSGSPSGPGGAGGSAGGGAGGASGSGGAGATGGTTGGAGPGSGGGGAGTGGAGGGAGGATAGGAGGRGGGGGGAGGAGAAGGGGTGGGGSGSGGSGGSGGGTPGTVVDPPCSDQVDNVAPSIDPPGGLAANRVPMFILLGFDDNAFVDGIDWTLDYFRNKSNADGTAARATYFISAGFASEFFVAAGGQTPAGVIESWKRIKNDGHEIANHSWSHGMQLAGSDAAAWQAELTRANDLFVNMLGVERCKLWGFRTPFLGFSQATFTAIKAVGFRYDTSVEFGYDWFQPPGSQTGYGPGTAEAGKHYYWPFTMNQPFPGGFASKGIMPVPGVWQFPVYTFNKITGETAATVTGFDFNLWNKAQSETSFSFTEVLKQSLDQRLAGNRSPFAVGLHTDVYSEFNESANTTWRNFTPAQRRKALSDFLDYAFTKPEVRFVTYRRMIEWLRAPKPL